MNVTMKSIMKRTNRHRARWAFAVFTALVVVATLPSLAFAGAGVGIDPGEIKGLPPIEAGAPTTIAVTVRNPGTESASYQMLAQPLNGVAELPIDPTWFSFEPATFDLATSGAQVGAAVATKLYFTVTPTPESSSGFPTAPLVGGTLVVGLAGGFVLYRRSGIRLSITRNGDRS
jgi:hypothetical protein